MKNVKRLFYTAFLWLVPLALMGEVVEGLVLPETTVTVGSPVQEIIAEIAVEEGDQVEREQVLARLTDVEERLDVERYARVLEKAQFDYDAAQALFNEKMGPKEAAVEKRAELERLKVEQKLAEARLNRKTIRSPIAGTVVRKHKEAGEAVDRVEPLFEIVNIDRVFLQFHLPGQHINRIRKGDQVPVTFPTLEKENDFTATVDFVDPRIDAASSLFRVKLLLPNPEHCIKAGMRVNATFSGD